MATEFFELAKNHPNDQDLGEYLRHEYAKDLNANPIVLKMIKETPNDFALGKIARAFFLNS